MQSSELAQLRLRKMLGHTDQAAGQNGKVEATNTAHSYQTRAFDKFEVVEAGLGFGETWCKTTTRASRRRAE